MVQDVLASLSCPDDQQSQLVGHLLSIHKTAEAQLSAAPRQFLSCAELYGRTGLSKREQLLQQQKFLKVCGCAASCASNVDDRFRAFHSVHLALEPLYSVSHVMPS